VKITKIYRTKKKFATKFKSFVFEIPKDHCPRPQLANKDINIEFWFSGFFSQTMIKNDSVFDEIISKMPYLFSESKLPVDCIFVLDCRRSAGVTGDFLHIPGNLGKHGFIETVARQFPTNLDYAGILYIDDLQMWRHKEREIIPEIQKHKNILILEPVAYPDDNLKNILSLIRKYSDHPITCITVVFLGNDKQKKRHKNSVGRNCDIKVLYRLDLYQKPTNLKVGYSKGTTKKQNIIRNGKGVD